MIRKVEIITILFVVLCLCTTSLQAARIITVDDDGPADFNNIQAAVNDANEGDIVEVRPGIYYENIRMIRMKDGITLQGSGPNVTTINGGQNGHVVSFNLASGAISGFTLTNSGDSDAGIFTSQCTVKIKNNIIVNNYYGISISSNSHAIITGSKIINNERFGIRVENKSSSAVITNNVIAHNGAYGIRCSNASAPFIINNTISHNGFIGIYLAPECTHTISNNIVTNNEYGIWAAGGTSSPVPLLQITYNNFNNTKANYWESYGIIGGGFGVSRPFTPRPGTGEIERNSLFADPYNGDYHLKSQAGRWDENSESWVQDDVTSPCIDAGNPHSPIGLEPFPNGGIINMGAYGGTVEASKSYFGRQPCEIIVAGDVNGDCLVNFLDFRLMALHWCEDNNP